MFTTIFTILVSIIAVIGFTALGMFLTFVLVVELNRELKNEEQEEKKELDNNL